MPHPQFLNTLFSHKSKVFSVFNDVLGLNEINHIALAYINPRQKLLTFSSTPALEFNLFNSSLWRFDKTYTADWYEQCGVASWQALYTQTRYDQLYYVKQARHHYPLALSLASKVGEGYIIYSIASRKNCLPTQEVFAQQYTNFYKIGQYCNNALLSLVVDCDSSFG